ncbi:hypothetical protein [Acidocella sp.]|uniref:hypothetical protein n=1 Tax=Acidocella sp. TaxID=50710 RepID=UPI003CFE3157
MTEDSVEFRQETADNLRNFRAALTKNARRDPLRKARLHDMVLKLGIWRAGGYAPFGGHSRVVDYQRHAQGRRWNGMAEVLPVELRLPPIGSAFPKGRGLRWEVSGWPWATREDAGKYDPHLVRRRNDPDGLLAVRSRVVRQVKAGPSRSFAPSQSVSPVMRAKLRGQSRNELTVRPPASSPDDEAGREEAASIRSMEVRNGFPSRTGVLPKEQDVLKTDDDGPSFGSPLRIEMDMAEALDDYFFRQSRLAPMGGTAFDPRLSPLWAGMKLPG